MKRVIDMDVVVRRPSLGHQAVGSDWELDFGPNGGLRMDLDWRCSLGQVHSCELRGFGKVVHCDLKRGRICNPVASERDWVDWIGDGRPLAVVENYFLPLDDCVDS